MHAIYKQTHPTTGIEQSLYCHFISTKEKNLIVSSVNQLSVYRINHDVEPSSSRVQEKSVEAKGTRQKLECLGTFTLFGTIMSMQSVRLVGSPRDALLISFSEATLALLEYDPGTHNLKTSSMHYFEEEEMKDGLVYHTHQPPIVRVDPDNRCAIMLIYGTRLVVLPFRKEGVSEESDDMMGSKSPILSSYLIDMRKLDEKIINILDVQFLHGYYEPTLFILYEPLPTWAGRIAVRKDSCSIAAISLNIQEKVHPIIWSLSNLPHDCLQAHPVPKPIGGVLLFAVNCLIYLNQSVPPFGVSLNSIVEHSTDFPLKPQEGVKITLDCANGCFIDGDKMVVSLKGGELYVLTIVVDGMRHVKKFNFDKSAASVLTTSMTLLTEGFLFLGSRLGNSLLLKYTEKSTAEIQAAKDTSKPDEPPTKKQKQETSDYMASDVSQIDDLDELEVYGRLPDTGPGAQITSYSFEVCDSIMNIGPCTEVVMGEPAFLSEEFGNLIDYDLELVTTSGFGKNGALSVLQRSIRPQIVTTFELPGCVDMWTVYGSKSDGENEDASDDADNGDEKHSFLILSREDSTMILQTGQEIMELDHSGFATQGPTIYAGNLGNNKYIIQVSPNGVRLLEGEEQLQHIPLDLNSPIEQCSVADPYTVIMSEDGQMILLTLRPDSFGQGVRLAVTKAQINTTPKVLTFCTYCDISGVFSETGKEDSNTVPVAKPRPSLDTSFSFEKEVVDDEDELLYGEADIISLQPKQTQPTTISKETVSDKKEQDTSPTYWIAMARDNGALEIYDLPEFTLSYAVKNFSVGSNILVDSGSDESSKSGPTEKLLAEGIPVVKELLIMGLGNRQSRPFLLARANEELLLYEAYPFMSTNINDTHLKMRFKKINHGLILKERKVKAKRKGEGETDEHPTLNDTIKWLRPFTDISGYAGVFVCGPYPHWIFMTYRGALRIHPMGIDGTVTCFTSFVNINCPKGFLYFNRQGELRISQLPTHLTYDAPWPVRKVPLRCTPHYVIYHPDSKTYAVVTSVPEVLTKVCKVTGEGEKAFDDQTRDDRFIWPTFNRFSVQLFSPISWEAIPNTRIELLENEHVTGAKCVNLRSEGTLTGKQGFVVLTTNMCHNEEVTSRGRVVILDIIEVVPEPGQPLTKNRIKVVYDKEQKGPVTAVDAVDGYLVTAIGQKIYIWQLLAGDLSGVAFIDTQTYIHSISVIKNLILLGDILKSISILRYQGEMKVLSLVSRDIKPCEVYSTEFLVDDTQLSFLVSDREKNLLVYSYQPEVRETQGGQRLLKKADINIGVHVNSFFRICCKRSDPSTGRILQANAKKHVTFFASLDGSIGYLLPIAEKVYRRLLMLQNVLNQHSQHMGGLNPKSYRLVQCPYRTLSNTQKNILDGDLLWQYLILSHMEKVEMAKKIGTNADQLVDDLMEIDRSTAHF